MEAACAQTEVETLRDVWGYSSLVTLTSENTRENITITSTPIGQY